LAEELAKKEDITVITNSVPVFDSLRNIPGITLISTGGIMRHSSETLVGPTTEAALRELRADKLFLAVTGITLDFGLSHTNVGEVAAKQAMIHAAREVILLADYTVFGRVHDADWSSHTRPQTNHRQRSSGAPAIRIRQTGHRSRHRQDIAKEFSQVRAPFALGQVGSLIGRRGITRLMEHSQLQFKNSRLCPST
jgi:hypothetical protein